MAAVMSVFFHLLLSTYAALFPICNPLGNAAIFVSITSSLNDAERRRQAFKGVLYMLALLLAFFAAGTWILTFFGISLDGVRIAGGLIVCRVGMQLLSPKKSDHHTPEEEAEAKSKPDVSFSPLALPLLAGPGSLSVVISMSASVRGDYVISYGAISAGIFLVCLTCLATLWQSKRLLDFLGVNGANALTRIMGFLLLCMGVQFIIAGVTGLIKTLVAGS